MDESLSWRARLAKANINILDLHDRKIFLEFTYHPKPGVFKWCKTWLAERYPLSEAGDEQEYDDFSEFDAQYRLDEVLKLRKELES